LNRQIRRQTTAFLDGVFAMIPAAWLRVFSVNELLLVLSGSDAPIDVDDWERQCVYDDEHSYERASPTAPVIKRFWAVVRKFSGAERQALLRFTTR
jgi:ubiquitin-protein ligase E3 C